MIVKSIIAGTVMSLLAGGVVYFGTEVEAANSYETRISTEGASDDISTKISDDVLVGAEENHPHDTPDDDKYESSTDIPSVNTPSGSIISAKAPTVSQASDSKKAEVKDEPKKSWLDKYLKTEKTKSEDKKPEDLETKPTETEAALGHSDSDTASYIIEDNTEALTESQIETAEAEGFEERVMETDNIWVEDGEENKKIIIKEVVKSDGAIVISEGPDAETKNIEVKVIQNEDGQTTIETETIDMGDGKIMKIVKKTIKSETRESDENNDMRIRVFTSKDGAGGLTAEDIRGLREGDDISLHKLHKDTKTKNISGTVKIVMAQAARIEMPELRDRAYLDIVSYGLDHGDYDVAARAMKEIEQVELRDTARNRMAVAYAKHGNAEEAFAILDSLEVDALRDVMRLQVIEAMIAPDQLPEDMQ